MRKIYRKITSFALILAILGGIMVLVPRAEAAEINPKSKINQTSANHSISVSIYINGQTISSYGRLIADTTYVSLRSVAEEFEDCNISWNQGIATVNSATANISAQQGSRYIVANDRVLYHDQPILNIDSRIYVPIRLIAKAYSLAVEWDDREKSVKLYGDPKGLKHGSDYYDSTDLYWLSRIIHAESGGESLLGKIAVGNVVLNRKMHSDYPNTVKGVIFDTKYGTQFTPVATGTIYNTPSNESILAAKICLDGYSINQDMIFFLNPKIATNFWIVNTRTHVVTIGNHKFYK